MEVRSKNDTNRYILKKFNKYRDAGVRVPVRIWDKQCVVDFAEIKEDLKSVFGDEPLTDV